MPVEPRLGTPVPLRRDSARHRTRTAGANVARRGTTTPPANADATIPPPTTPVVADDATILEGILRALDALVIVTDAQGRVTRFNPRCEAITGYTEAEVLGRHASELVAADQTADVATLVARLGAEGGTIATTQALIARDGRKRIIDWVNTAIVRDGHIVSLIGTGTDVTEARRAEEAVAAIEVIGDLLATHGPSPDILHRSLRELQDRFDYRYLSIYLLDGNARTLNLGAQIGYSMPVDTFDADTGVIGRVLRTRERQFIPDTSLDADYISADDHVKSEICVPLAQSGELLGIINIEADEPPLDTRDLSLLQAIADRIAGSLALGRKVRQLEVQAFHDPLTGLANRALFQDRLEHALRRAARTARRVACCSSTSTTSRRSTTASATPSATSCCVRSPSGCARCAARRTTPSRASAATSSRCCCEDVRRADGERGATRSCDALRTPVQLVGRAASPRAPASASVARRARRGRRAAARRRHRDVPRPRRTRQGPAWWSSSPRCATRRSRGWSSSATCELADRSGEFSLDYQPIVDLEPARRRRRGARAVAAPHARRCCPRRVHGVAEETGLIVAMGRRLLRRRAARRRHGSSRGCGPFPSP